MRFDPDKHHRRSHQLPEYDYSRPGAYFVTICTFGRECLFGEIAEEEMWLNDAGAVVESVWQRLPNHYQDVIPDEFVIMPNHLHGIIIITEGNGVQIHHAATKQPVGAGLKPAPTRTRRHGLSEIVRAFKTFSSRRVNELRGIKGVPVWQRNYYEHVIRNERSLNSIRQYIRANPGRWAEDPENPHSVNTLAHS